MLRMVVVAVRARVLLYSRYTTHSQPELGVAFAAVAECHPAAEFRGATRRTGGIAWTLCPLSLVTKASMVTRCLDGVLPIGNFETSTVAPDWLETSYH